MRVGLRGDAELLEAAVEPAIQPSLVSRLCQRARESPDGTLAVVPRTRTPRGLRYQALHALYRPDALPTALGSPNLQSFIAALPCTEIIDEPALRDLDPRADLSLFNVNTPADLMRLEQLYFDL